MNLTEIEKNKKFKKFVLSKGIWKNYAFVPPSLVLFGGLFGLLYLFQNDLLISWYSLPFIVIFAIGTIWFKSIRKYLIDKKIKDLSSFLVCVTTPLIDTSKNTILLFTTRNNRHNIDFTERIKREILEQNIELNEIMSKHKSGIPLKLDDKGNFLINNKLPKHKNKLSREKQYLILINNVETRIIPTHVISKFLTQKK